MGHSRLIARAAAGAVLALAIAAEAQPVGEGWLMEAETDAERWDLLQEDLAGFSRAMWEVGYRFREMHAAIEDGHLELAAHHWDSLGSAVERGLVRRPGRAENANGVLMASVYGEVMAALESGDQEQAKAAFMTARSACMACHVAEERPYLNDQRLFLLGF